MMISRDNHIETGGHTTMPKYKSPQDRGMPFNIYLPSKQVQAVNELADRQGVNRSALIGKAIEVLLDSSGMKEQAATVAAGK